MHCLLTTTQSIMTLKSSFIGIKMNNFGSKSLWLTMTWMEPLMELFALLKMIKNGTTLTIWKWFHTRFSLRETYKLRSHSCLWRWMIKMTMLNRYGCKLLTSDNCIWRTGLQLIFPHRNLNRWRLRTVWRFHQVPILFTWTKKGKTTIKTFRFRYVLIKLVDSKYLNTKLSGTRILMRQ